MGKTILSEKEQLTLANLICFLYENEQILKEIYNKTTSENNVFYSTKKQSHKPLTID